jgi:hypothetical protein
LYILRRDQENNGLEVLKDILFEKQDVFSCFNFFYFFIGKREEE